MQITPQLVATSNDVFSPTILIVNNDEAPQGSKSEHVSLLEKFQALKPLEDRGVPMSALND
jgi:hypothetical protein